MKNKEIEMMDVKDLLIKGEEWEDDELQTELVVGEELVKAYAV